MRMNRDNPRAAFEKAITQKRINTDDGREALAYIDEEKTFRKWKEATVARQLQCIRPFLERLRTKRRTLATLDKAGVLDLIDYLQHYDSWSEASRPGNWNRFARFYKWAYRRAEGTWDATARDLLIGDHLVGGKRWKYRADQNLIKKKDTFEVREVIRLVNLEPLPCYKAFVGVVFETGMRIGEALPLRLQDVKRTARGFDLTITQSKTEARTVWVEKYFVADLDRWLKQHPLAGDPDAPLYLNSLGQPLAQKTANKRLKELAAKAYPHKKKVSVHSLRHSWATYCAEFMTEQQMKAFFGWKGDSDMPSVYVRQNKLDVRKAMRQAHGLEHEQRPEQGRTCTHCGSVNDEEVEYCERCRLPLDEKKRAAHLLTDGMEAIVQAVVAKLREEQA